MTYNVAGRTGNRLVHWDCNYNIEKFTGGALLTFSHARVNFQMCNGANGQ